MICLGVYIQHTRYQIIGKLLVNPLPHHLADFKLQQGIFIGEGTISVRNPVSKTSVALSVQHKPDPFGDGLAYCPNVWLM